MASSSTQPSPQQIQNEPALQPPLGVLPNFVNPPSFQASVDDLEGVFVSFMLVAVAIRIYVRIKITKLWGWDDYTCIAAAFGSLAHVIVYVEMFKVGFGRHLWDIRALTLLNTHNTRILSSDGVTYPFTVCFAKISILLLYLRIFKLDRTLRLAIHAGLLFTTLWYTAIMGVAIASIVKCNGLAQLSNQFCLNYEKPVVVMNAVINVVTDFYILILPVPCVMKLQTNKKRKIGLLLVFASGLVSCAASLTRMIIFCVHYKSADVLWVQGRNAQFTVIEIDIAIIVACASTFPAFFSRFRVLSSEAYSFLRSHIVYTTRSSRGIPISDAGASLPLEGGKQNSSDTTPDNRSKSKGDGFYELRDVEGVVK
ncbi:hypothetical protein BDR22DRAFT_696860 [Usnea florida]